MPGVTIVSRFWNASFIVEPRPVTDDALSNLLILSSDSTLNGDRYRGYADLAEVTADNALTYVSAAALARATIAFRQSPAPSVLYIGRRDTSGTPETYQAALTAVAAAGLAFGLVDSDADSGAEAASVAAYCDAASPPVIAIITGAEGGWITGTPPGSYPTTSDSTAVVYHPTAGQYPATAILSRAAGTPADSTRPDFTAPLAGVATYSLTTTQYDFVQANHANPLVPLQNGGTVLYPPPGGILAMSGENLYTRFTVMFFTYRWRSAIAAAYAKFAAQNKVWPYNAAGQAALASALQPAIDTGLAVGYLTPLPDLPRGYEITYALAGGVITATARLGLLDGTTEIVTVTYLERAA